MWEVNSINRTLYGDELRAKTEGVLEGIELDERLELLRTRELLKRKKSARVIAGRTNTGDQYKLVINTSDLPGRTFDVCSEGIDSYAVLRYLLQTQMFSGNGSDVDYDGMPTTNDGLHAQRWLEERGITVNFAKKKTETNIIDVLLKQGVDELYAVGIKQCLDDLVERCEDVGIRCKNVVYKAVDKKGRRLILKFVGSKDEAHMENLVLTEFGKHHVLSRYVPKVFTEEPVEIKIGEETKYLVIQEDVSRKADMTFERKLIGSKREITEYLTYWMKALARIHVYGTEIMDRLGNYHKALRLTKEKDDDRISRSHIVYDKRMRCDLKQQEREDRFSFIHQDIRYANRIGQYAIDWGHSGRGNEMLDVARVLEDYRVAGFKDDEFEKYFLEIYLKEKRKIERGKDPKRDDIARTHHEFRRISLLYCQAESAYHLLKARTGEIANGFDIHNNPFMQMRITDLERKLRTTMN